MQIEQGRGETLRGLLWHLLFLVAVCQAWVSVVGGGMHLVSAWMTRCFGTRDCTSVKNATIVALGFLLGPYAGVVKRVAGVRGGARSARTFFSIFVALQSRKESSKLLPLRRASANPKPACRGLLDSRRTRVERVRLVEACRAPQDGYTPLHFAAFKGHETVVKQLLAAGADTEAKDQVSGERRMRNADRAGSRGDTRRVGASSFSRCCLLSLGFCLW